MGSILNFKPCASYQQAQVIAAYSRALVTVKLCGNICRLIYLTVAINIQLLLSCEFTGSIQCVISLLSVYDESMHFMYLNSTRVHFCVVMY